MLLLFRRCDAPLFLFFPSVKHTRKPQHARFSSSLFCSPFVRSSLPLSHQTHICPSSTFTGQLVTNLPLVTAWISELTKTFLQLPPIDGSLGLMNDGGKAAEQRRTDEALVDGGGGNYATLGGAQQRTSPSSSSASFDPARLFSVIRQRSRGVQDLAALLSSGSSNADRSGLVQALPLPNLRQACFLALELGRKDMLSLLLDTYGLPSTRLREPPSSRFFQRGGPSSTSPPPSQSASPPLSPISSAPAPAPTPAVAREEQHLLTRALQKGDAAMVQLVVGYVEGQDPDVHVPELPK